MSAAEANSSTRKRTRAEDGGDAGAIEPTMIRSSDFYFNDGTIVLRVLSKENNTYTLFRVHKSLLALHCTVFRAMFGDEDAVHLNNASEQYDDVPLMHLHDDVRDLEDFLRALYHPEFMQRHHNFAKYGLQAYEYDFPTMYARAMRPAKKYGAEQLIELFVHALRQVWPSDWNKSLALAKAQTESVTEPLIDMSHRTYRACYSNPVWSIRMAVDLGVIDILPFAFNALYARLGPGIDVVDIQGLPTGSPPDTDEDLSILNANELLCLFLGGRNLASYVFEFTSERPTPPAGAFRVPADKKHDCYDSFIVMWTTTMKAMEGAGCASDPFVNIRSVDVALCHSCREDARALLDEVQFDLWTKLPKFYDTKRCVQ